MNIAITRKRRIEFLPLWLQHLVVGWGVALRIAATSVASDPQIDTVKDYFAANGGETEKWIERHMGLFPAYLCW